MHGAIPFFVPSPSNKVERGKRSDRCPRAHKNGLTDDRGKRVGRGVGVWGVGREVVRAIDAFIPVAAEHFWKGIPRVGPPPPPLPSPSSSSSSLTNATKVTYS